MPDNFAYGESGKSVGIAESRAHKRTQVRALGYIELSEDNGGLILNISEDGLAVQAVQVVSTDDFPRMRFRLPKTEATIEVAGRMVWQLRSKKEAGIQFVGLSEEDRARIRQWIATEPSRLAATDEVDRQRTPRREKPPLPVQAEAVPKAPAPPPEPRVILPPSLAQPTTLMPDLPAAEIASSPPLPEVATRPQPPAKPKFDRVPDLLPRLAPDPIPAPISAGAAKAPLPRLPEPPVSSSDHARNLPSWNSSLYSAVSTNVKKPQHWWSYTAAFGIIAVLGLAAVVILDPGAISRLRSVGESQQPDATSSSSQSGNAENNGPAATSPNGQQSPTGSGASIAPDQQIPQKMPAVPSSGSAYRGQTKNQPGYSANDGALGSAGKPNQQTSASPARPLVPVNPLADNQNEASSSTSREKTNQHPSQPGAPLNASQANAPANSRGVAAQSVQSQATPPNPSVAQLQQSPAPAAPSNAAAAPANQQAAPRKDQDANAQPAKRDQDSFATPNQGKQLQSAAAESSPVPPSVPLSGVPSGSVAASSQFHAIRIPPELRDKPAQLAGNLQIGQLISSYSPTYPIEAARAGVEGIAKLDVIVAPNGTVETVKMLSGPALLTEASVNAVEQWRYGQTLLGGQPIGVEQYVTVVFRLAKQTPAK